MAMDSVHDSKYSESQHVIHGVVLKKASGIWDSDVEEGGAPLTVTPADPLAQCLLPSL